ASLSEGLGSPEFQQGIAESTYVSRFARIDRSITAMKKNTSPAFGQGADAHAVADHCEMDEWQLVMLAKVLAHCRVKVVTDGLPAEVLRKCHVEPAASVEQAVADCLAEYGPEARVVVIPKGPYVLPCVA